MIRVGIVADDLTGAMDAAAPFADCGLATRMLLSVQGGAEDGSDPAVLAIDTHSRDASADAAARAVRAGFARLAGGRLPFKKIDSTLRGNISAEIAAAMQACGRSCALVAPSAPQQGRVLREGHLFVNGVSIEGPSLIETLRKGLPGHSVRPLRSGDAPGDEPCVFVADAETEHDLARIAALCMAAPRNVLLVGSSGLASAVAQQMQLPQLAPAHPTYERLLIVVGSHNARSAAQARALLARDDVEALALTPGGDLRRTVDPRRRPRALLLHVEGLGEPPTLDRQWVSQHLAHAAADLLAAQGGTSTGLFLTGGDTAGAVLSRLQVDRIDVIGTLYPGIVHGRISTRGRSLGVITKAGGFGTADTLVQAVADLFPPAR